MAGGDFLNKGKLWGDNMTGARFAVLLVGAVVVGVILGVLHTGTLGIVIGVPVYLLLAAAVVRSLPRRS